jgi:hypothetical protein
MILNDATGNIHLEVEGMDVFLSNSLIEKIMAEILYREKVGL